MVQESMQQLVAVAQKTIGCIFLERAAADCSNIVFPPTNAVWCIRRIGEGATTTCSSYSLKIDAAQFI
jgi:hypothetical protein